MKARTVFIAFWAASAALLPCIPAGASQEFKTNNPDTGKYAFARSYISALGYVEKIDRRWKTSSPVKVYAAGGDDVKVMRAYVAFVIRDNTDLRIAKNYMTKYLESPNALIKKTADMFIAAC